MKRLNPEVADTISRFEPRAKASDHSIPDALDVLAHYISAQQRRIPIRPTLDLEAALSGKRDRAFIVVLLRDSLAWLRFFHESVVARASLWTDEVVSGFNEASYARIPFATRALLELFLYTFDTYRRIYNLDEKARSAAPSEAIAYQWETRDLLLRQARAARINWDDPFGPEWKAVREEVKQTNVLSLISKLPAEDRDQVERWYALLSDACHPNFGSILLSLDHDRFNDDPLTFAFAESSASAEHLQLVLDICGAPLCFSWLQTVSFLQVIDAIRNHYGEGVRRFGNGTSDDD